MPATSPAMPRGLPAAPASMAAALLCGLAATLQGFVEPQLVVLLGLAPVLEEIVFRAGLQQSLQRRLGRGAGAVVLTAIAFAGVHVLLHPGPLAGWTLLPALAIGWVYRSTQSLPLCIATHAIFNLVWLLGASRLALT